MVLDRNSRDYEILKKTIFAEARGEIREGQNAVAWVIYNRLHRNPRRWGHSLADVCLQPHQFECWTPRGIQEMNTAIQQEHGVFNQLDEWLPKVFHFSDPTARIGGADHYNNPDKENASWTSGMSSSMRIGNHVFYKE